MIISSLLNRDPKILSKKKKKQRDPKIDQKGDHTYKRKCSK